MNGATTFNFEFFLSCAKPFMPLLCNKQWATEIAQLVTTIGHQSKFRRSRFIGWVAACAWLQRMTNRHKFSRILPPLTKASTWNISSSKTKSSSKCDSFQTVAHSMSRPKTNTPFTWRSIHEANVFKIHLHDVCSEFASCLLPRVNGV